MSKKAAKAVEKKKAKTKPPKASPPRKIKPAKAPAPAKTAPAKTAPAKPAKAKATEAKGRSGGMPHKDKEQFRGHLLKLRDQVTGHISFLSDDSLNRVDDTPTEDRTDDFDREFALNLVSSEHDALFEIDEALRRLDEGTYGVCDACSQRIEKARLQALPFAKQCVRCQSQSERGRTKFRPFGVTISQVAERAPETGPAPAEEEETE